MVNKPKIQGTKGENFWRTLFKPWGAKRIAEGGSADEGDVEFWVGKQRFVLESKATQALNVTRVLKAATLKALRHDPNALVVLGWKRVVKKPGAVRRGPDGCRAVVVMEPETFVWLLEQIKK